MNPIFDLAAKISVDSSGFDKGVSDAEHSGKSLSDNMSGMFDKIEGAAKLFLSGVAIKKVADLIQGLAEDTAAAGDKIDKQSQMIGMSRKAYQEWDYILSQNGTSIDNMAAVMKTLNKEIQEGAEGAGEAGDTFAELGLHIDDLNTLSQEDQFEAVVRAFQKMPAGARKAALAVELFGRQGQKLMPLLNNSETSIDELRARAEELGLFMSDEAVDASVAYTDSLDTMKRTFNSLKYSVGASILPILTGAMQKIASFAGKLKKAYDDRGLAGVWDVLKESFQNIQWPTWDDVKTALTNAWSAVQEGAKSVLKLVFGETADGGIKWPTADEIWIKVKTGLETLWNGIKTLATTVLKLVFGEDANGGIDWGTAEGLWYKIGEGLRTLWEGIKSFAKNVLVFAFGQDKDGGIKFPTAEETYRAIGNALSAWWGGVRRLCKGILNLLLGALGLPDVDETVKQIKAWWKDVKSKIALKIFVAVGGYKGLGFDPEKGETWAEGVQRTNEEWGFKPADLSQVENLYDEHAKGLNTVPYDDYRASLHRGEMVLTASQARDYREGRQNSDIDLSALAGTISSAVKSAIESATIRSYLNGRDITDEVNRNNMQSLKARRFGV